MGLVKTPGLWLGAGAPFCFHSTVESEIKVRRMEDYPPLVDQLEGNIYRTTIRLPGGIIAGLEIAPSGENAGIEVAVYAPGKLCAGEMEFVSDTVCWCWGLNEDAGDFYEKAAGPVVIGRLVDRHRGLRSITWQEPFQIVCIAILLQNATIARTNAMIYELVTRYGLPVEFAGVNLWHWFPPETLADVDPDALKETCRLGFRASRLTATARALAEGAIDWDWLRTAPLQEARSQLETLNGIGPYSADVILLGLRRWEAFPLDVWSARQFHRILFPGTPVPAIAEAIEAVDKRASELWGSWRGLVQGFSLHELDELAEEAERERDI